MNGSSKGVLVVVLIAIASAVGYYIYDEKKKKATLANVKDDGIVAGVGNIVADATKTVSDAAKAVAGIATGKTQVKLTPANDVLSGDINAANKRQLWAMSDGATIYNMANQPSGKTTKNQFLGIVYSARPAPTGGFIITFLGTTKAQYWITSGSMAIKM